MRYSNTERLGVIATDNIVTRDIGWIFREQPIVDVGIDALIEQVESSYPKGKFIAVQIKSGEANFHCSSNKLTYYASNIHCAYWLDFNIPVLLVAHLPSKEATYWTIINEDTLKKTKKGWKIEISTKKKFDAESKKELIRLIAYQKQKPYGYYKVLLENKIKKYNLFTNNIDELYSNNNASGVFRFLAKLNIKKLYSEITKSLKKINDKNIKLFLVEDKNSGNSINHLYLETNDAIHILINGNLNNCWKNFSIVYSLIQIYLDLGEPTSSKKNCSILEAIEEANHHNVEKDDAFFKAANIIVAPKDRKLVYEIGRTLINDTKRGFSNFDLAESYQYPEAIIKFYRENIEKDIFFQDNDK